MFGAKCNIKVKITQLKQGKVGESDVFGYHLKSKSK